MRAFCASFACGAFSRFSLFMVKVVSLLTSRVSGVCFPIFRKYLCLPFFSIFACSCIMDRFDKTVTVQTPPEVRRCTQPSVLPSILDKMGKDAVNSVQFLPGGSFQAPFSSRECKVMLEDIGRIVIGSYECTIRATGPPQVDVYVHYYPFEAPDADIRGALSKFGQIKSTSPSQGTLMLRLVRV